MGDHGLEPWTYGVSNRCSTAELIALTPPPGFEPGTDRLTVDCSTAELRRNGPLAGLLVKSLASLSFGDFRAANLGQLAQFEEGFAGASASSFVAFLGELGVFFHEANESLSNLIGSCGHCFKGGSRGGPKLSGGTHLMQLT